MFGRNLLRLCVNVSKNNANVKCFLQMSKCIELYQNQKCQKTLSNNCQQTADWITLIRKYTRQY